MQRRLSVLSLVLLAASACAEAAPRGAALYSSFRDGAYWYRDEQAAVFRAAGWDLDAYENTRVADLIAALDRYAVVVLGTSYNYEHPQDLAASAAAWQAFLERGGCLVVTDANYASMYAWLSAVHPALRWGSRGEMNPWREAPPAWTDAGHPLLRDVKPPNVPWTFPSYWSQAFTVLVADADRRPVVAYLEVGKGIVVVSSAYRQYDFPTAPFLRNLVAWAKDPQRRAAVAQRQEAAKAAAQNLPGLDVPTLDPAPTLDGTPGVTEWQRAAVLPDFVAMDGGRGLTQRTVCRVGQTPQGLFVAFECYDHDVANLSRRIGERDGAVWTDDCVEVFLDPSGGQQEYLHFAVSAAGTQYDERGADPGWDRYWEARTSVAAGMWTAELYIPFAALDVRADRRPAAVWTGNFYREYPGRGGVPQELSGWSPTFSSFGSPSRFGMLRGINAPAERYVLAPEIGVQTPERWFGGDNPLTATVTALPGQSAAFSLACVEVGSQRLATTAAAQELAAGQRVEVGATVSLSTDGPRWFQFLARAAAEPERVLASSRAFRAVPAAPLEMTLLAPVFRGTVQSRDPDKTLRLRVQVGDPGPAAGALYLRASLLPRGRLRPLWQEVQTVIPRTAVSFAGALAEVPPGDYDVQVDLQDEAHRLLAQDRCEVKVLAAAPVEVSFDAKRACRVNGKTLFPIGLYHVSEPALTLVNGRAKELGLPELTLEEMLAGCRDHGFNTLVRGWGMPGEEYMQRAQKLGLWVMPEVGAPDAVTLAAQVALANRFSNLLMWYGIDEPGGERLQQALEAHARFARADPHRPVSAACNNVGVFADGVRAYDLLLMDPYFIFPKRGTSLEAIGGWVDAGLRASGRRLPVWVVPQAFAIDQTWAEPTGAELRCQAYLSIVHGATGLIWYAWYTTEPWSQNPRGRNQWFLPDSPLWPCFTGLNAEITQLAPVILEGEVRGPAACDSEAIHSQSWEADGAVTLIAVNPRDREVTCRLSGLPGTVATVLFEDRQVAVQDGACTDTFAPWAARVYRLAGSATGK
jgi:hypothetical protein